MLLGTTILRSHIKNGEKYYQNIKNRIHGEIPIYILLNTEPRNTTGSAKAVRCIWLPVFL